MKLVKILFASIVVLVTLGLSSCNQNNPSEAWFFNGKYNGLAGFDKLGDGVPPKAELKTDITVLKVADLYTFKFSNSSIPTLTGVKMEMGEKTLTTISGDKAGAITVTGDRITILYKNKQGTWVVPNATRVK